MTDASLSIDLAAVSYNWSALDALSSNSVETGAVVKADAYGLGVGKVAPVLAKAGARSFFVALASEGVALRKVLGEGPKIYVFSGFMAGSAAMIRDAKLIPLLNSPKQVAAFINELAGHPCGLQLDSGMNRLGIEPVDIPGLLFQIPVLSPELVISHLACADEPAHLQNAAQLASFVAMSTPLFAKKSLAATGGILLGDSYHFDLTRPGVGLFGGLPFENARPVVTLDVPVIQTRDVLPSETVGYGAAWHARKLSKIATISAGYADGLKRGLAGAQVYAGPVACPVVGRVSMDLITVDVTHLDDIPDYLTVLGPHQTIDELAANADTIGYEILTSLGHRYNRRYVGV